MTQALTELPLTAVFLMPWCLSACESSTETRGPCSSMLMSVIICNLLICRDDNNPATCLPDYQCIMLRLYSGAFQCFTFMQQAEAERDNTVLPLKAEGYHCLKGDTHSFTLQLTIVRLFLLSSL